jgi:hypothetical protein
MNRLMIAGLAQMAMIGSIGQADATVLYGEDHVDLMEPRPQPVTPAKPKAVRPAPARPLAEPVQVRREKSAGLKKLLRSKGRR